MMLGEMFQGGTYQSGYTGSIIFDHHATQPTILTMEYIQQHSLHSPSIEISCYIRIHICDC